MDENKKKAFCVWFDFSVKGNTQNEAAPILASLFALNWDDIYKLLSLSSIY